jgi:hypothetical protein
VLKSEGRYFFEAELQFATDSLKLPAGSLDPELTVSSEDGICRAAHGPLLTPAPEIRGVRCHNAETSNVT